MNCACSYSRAMMPSVAVGTKFISTDGYRSGSNCMYLNAAFLMNGIRKSSWKFTSVRLYFLIKDATAIDMPAPPSRATWLTIPWLSSVPVACSSIVSNLAAVARLSLLV